jgi:WD40 repeat protein
MANSDPRLVRALTGHTGRVFAVTLSADGRLLVSGDNDGGILQRRLYPLAQ